jgi:hypothetical protein
MNQMCRQTFQSHGPMKTCVFRPVNHTHSATAEFLQDSVVRKDLTGMKLQFVHFR